jgi:hypothetical protein
VRHEVTIGVAAENIEAVTRAIRDLTGWSSEAHDSSYLGEYDLFHTPDKVMVKYNFVDAEDEWDFPDHQHFAVLIVIGETSQPEFFHQLAAKLGLKAEVIRDKSW